MDIMKQSAAVKALYMRYLGCLGFIAEVAVKLDDEDRETIETIMEDACAHHRLEYKRILNRFEIGPSFEEPYERAALNDEAGEKINADSP